VIAGPTKGSLEELATDPVALKLVADGDPELQLSRTDAGKAQVADDPLPARNLG
jgi:hypothetical protein